MAIDTIFLDSGVLRAYIDRRDRVHEKCFAMIHDYLDLHCVYSTTTLNISELSFWLDKTRARSGMRNKRLDKLANSINLKVFEIGENFAEPIFREWLCFRKEFDISLDFTDFYLYTAALYSDCDYIMTTDLRDFSKLLALAPSYSFAQVPIQRNHFTQDDVIFV